MLFHYCFKKRHNYFQVVTLASTQFCNLKIKTGKNPHYIWCRTENQKDVRSLRITESLET